ncbi:hypothetical protein [Aeromonas hydrophila]|uniref:hypothetical protein n=2 Tax=Aeromonas hydrophila TaxID=644 RepID=UPI000AE9B06F|nr:hypothetical protein [Aeromonas hydrophila]EGX6956762.1 hypothetical protein [Aeromonas hydrophila]EGX6960760.1 hypothetical protein [Aeromonas hydrophila]MCA4698760.1 hypothetical protein [Aeromonas hydrophila]HAT1533548.1 hypothetical protein [Aeromonas hydrophila]HAT1535174.1 hypothetical protein [Aeromonas hydrophila]
MISFILLVGYVLFPFINGVGCDFRAQFNDANISYYSTCKMGVATTIAKNNKTGEMIQYDGIYSKSGNTIRFFVFKIDELKEIRSIDKDTINSLAKCHLYVMQIIVDEEHDWVVLSYPFPWIHKAKRIGKLGFW